MTEPAHTSLLISPGSQLLAVLLAGLLMTFSFQLLLTSLGMLASLVILKLPLVNSLQSSRALATSKTQSATTASESSGQVQEATGWHPIGFLAGLGILLSLLLTLLPASFLAVKLSQIRQPLLGAIAGLVLWSADILLLTWLSSQAVNSLIQILFGGLLKGIEQLLSVLISWVPDTTKADSQASYETELKGAIATLNTRLETYIKTLALPTSQGPELETSPTASSSTPASPGLTPWPNPTHGSDSAMSLPSVFKAGIDRLARQIDTRDLLGQLLQRVDLSDWDIARVWQQVQATRQQVTGAEPDPLEVLAEEVENYLLTAPLWALKPAALAEELPDLLYDPEANPEAMQQQLNRLEPDWSRQLLQRRTDLPPEQLSELANTFEQLRQTALARCAEYIVTAPEPLWESAIADLQAKLSAYLRYTNLGKLTDAGIQEKLRSLAKDTPLKPAELRQALPDLNLPPLEETLRRRRGLDHRAQQRILNQLQTHWQALLPAPSPTHQIVDTLKTILPDQHRLTLEDLKPYILDLIDSPQMAAHHLGQSLTQLDWSPLAQLLSDHTLAADQAQTALQWVQQQVFAAARLPRRWLTRFKDQSQFWQRQIQRYLRHQDKVAFTPEQMQDDLYYLMSLWPWMPGTERVSVDALTPLLHQREDLNSDEIEQITAGLQTAWDQAIDQMDRVQTAAQSDWESLWEILSTPLDSAPLPDVDTIQQALADLVGPLGQTFQDLSQSLTLWQPDSPLKTLKQSLQNLDQDALHKLIQTREDLSENVRDYLEDQLTTFRHSLEQQLYQLEYQALQQLNQLRHTAAIAAVWLLAIMLTTATGASLAGLLAARSFF